jgi:hypothetical protein
VSNRDTAATLEYHEATKHSERSVRTSRHFLDFENQPLAFKIYRDLEAIPLSQHFPGNDLPALESISPMRSRQWASKSACRSGSA